MRDWFETLPFHRGMSLLGIAVLVPAAVVGGTVMLGGGSTTTAARPPSTRGGVNAAAVPRQTWGAYVPPRTAVPTPVRTQRRSMILVRPTPTVTRPQPSPSTTCPTGWKKWRWLWDVCRRNTTGHIGR
jgi:hypothetical protein